MPVTRGLYVGTENGLRILTYVDQQWRQVSTDQDSQADLKSKHIVSLADAKSNPARIYAAAQGYGVFKTEDKGLSWRQILSANVYALLMDPNNDERLWVGLEPAGVLRTVDGGQTWQDLQPNLYLLPEALSWHHPRPPYEARVGALALAPDQPEHLFGAVQVGGLLISPDGGETWASHDDFLEDDIHALAFHPTEMNIWLATTSDGVYRSTDGGQTWVDASEGLEYTYAGPVVLLRDGGCFLAATGTAPGNWVENLTSVLYYSPDLGERWHLVDWGEMQLITTLVSHDHQAQSLYLGSQSGAVFESQNRGQTWHKIWQSEVSITALQPYAQ